MAAIPNKCTDKLDKEAPSITINGHKVPIYVDPDMGPNDPPIFIPKWEQSGPKLGHSHTAQAEMYRQLIHPNEPGVEVNAFVDEALNCNLNLNIMISKIVHAAWIRCNKNQSETAKRLKISRKTVYKYLKAGGYLNGNR